MVAKHDPPRDGDIRDSQADITQARNFLGYDPQVDFEEGLRRTFEWYKTTAQAKAAQAQAQTSAPATAPAK
jgi:nucleoside-diphosphate-sugar epimerase